MTRHMTRTLLATLLLSGTAAGAAWAQSGTLIITNKSPSTATLLDINSGTVMATLPTGQGPHEVVATRDGRIAVVTDYGAQQAGSSLTVIDVPARRVARTISLGTYRRPHGIVFLPGDSLVAVTSEANDALLIVHVGRGEIVRSIPTTQRGSHMVGVTGDGRRAWTGNIGSNTVSELDLLTGAFVRTIAVPAQPEAINVTPDGREVWVGSNATGVVSVVDPSTGAVTPAATGLGWPYRVAYTPDTALVLLPDLRGETLRFLDRRTRAERHRIALPGAAPQGIVFAHDGRHAFLSLSAKGVIAVIDVRAQRIIREIAAGETPDGVAYAPAIRAR
jgi:DNA-binding beta-propeller fold protein YncE